MIAAVERGDVDVGVVPIENTIEGSVSVTLDTLAFDSELLIQREVDLPVSLNLCAPPGTKLADITHRRVAPATRSARAAAGWRRTCPTPTAVAANSTSEAARQVAKSQRTGMASIGTAPGRRPTTGLEILASEIEDHPENQTRFVLVGHGIPAPTGHDKTSIVCFQRQDRPGSLLAHPPGVRGPGDQPHQARVAARPSASLGDYCFFIDFEGHLADEVVADASRNLAAKQARGEVPRLVSRRRPDEGHVRRTRRRPRRGATRPRGSTALRDADPRRRRAVIDLKRLRDEPEYRARHRAQAGARRPDRRRARGRRRAPRAARRRSRTCAPRQNAASKEIGKAAPDERAGEDRSGRRS